jgi:hypothetical protein
MVTLLRAADRAPGPSRTIRFEGSAHGTDISFFAVDNEPGQGPGLHIHPIPKPGSCMRGMHGSWQATRHSTSAQATSPSYLAALHTNSPIWAPTGW